ncbi:hypothetical protein [uncultured Mediterranean phage uvDeep-CGR2-KM21-C88]|nr:hypothetical protein [uncultured Mediterranean phage uvDeep-CGR2-KM21-C88]
MRSDYEIAVDTIADNVKEARHGLTDQEATTMRYTLVDALKNATREGERNGRDWICEGLLNLLQRMAWDVPRMTAAQIAEELLHIIDDSYSCTGDGNQRLADKHDIDNPPPADVAA